jgi:acyl-CoA thioester hydrolase
MIFLLSACIIFPMKCFRFYHPVEIRYGDLDPQGHLNNAKYLTFMEQTRVQYFLKLGLWDGRSFMHIGIILADAQVSFKAPILYGQDVRVGMRVSGIGNKSITTEYCLEEADTGTLFATGTSIAVAYDYYQSRTFPVSDEWRRVISEFEGQNFLTRSSD